MTTYDQVVKAAQRLVTDDTRDMWGLADAIVLYVPETTNRAGVGGRGNSSPETGTSFRLAALADQMKTDGITMPSGDFYTEASLSNLREQSITWGQDERHPEAAFSTHREAGSPNTEGGKVLAALAAVARGESPAKPRGIDAGAWAKAVQRVQTRRKGFPVAANDVNVALQRKTNGSRSGGGGGGGKVTKSDIEDAIASGDITPQEVASVLPSDTLVGEWIDRREPGPPLTEGMSPEEVTRSDQMIDALQSSVDAMAGLSKDATEGWWQRDMIHAQGDLVAVLRHIGPDMGIEEIQFFDEHFDGLIHVLDMARMKVHGGGLPDEVEGWLKTQTAS